MYYHTLVFEPDKHYEIYILVYKSKDGISQGYALVYKIQSRRKIQK